MHEEVETRDRHQGYQSMIPFVVWLLDFLQTRIPLHLFGVGKKRVDGFMDSRWKVRTRSDLDVTWFHASSLGELEMLRPLIDDFLDAGVGVGVSVFSDSALLRLS